MSKKKGSKKVEKNPQKKKANGPTIKSILIKMTGKEGGATLDEVAKECERLKIRDFERAKATARLWIPKLGIKLQRDKETGKYTHAS